MSTRKASDTPDAAVEAADKDIAAAQKVNDLGQAEAQAIADKETAQGFSGVKTDPVPNEEYSLLTGPDSPSALPDHTTRASQHSAGADTERSN